MIVNGFDVDFYSNKKLLVIPHEPDAFAKLQSIDRKTRYECGAKYGIASMTDWQMNTVANECFETIIQSLAIAIQGVGTDSAINFYDLFFVKATNRISEKADKEGNINIVFQPGPRAIELIGLDKPPEITEPVRPTVEFGFDEDQKELEDMFKRIDRSARYQLSKKYRMLMMDEMEMAAIAILDQFILNIFIYMLYELGSNPELTMSSVNFNDNVEFHATRQEDDKVALTMRPGMNAKLIIKSDESTEESSTDDDD